MSDVQVALKRLHMLAVAVARQAAMGTGTSSEVILLNLYKNGTESQMHNIYKSRALNADTGNCQAT